MHKHQPSLVRFGNLGGTEEMLSESITPYNVEERRARGSCMPLASISHKSMENYRRLSTTILRAAGEKLTRKREGKKERKEKRMFPTDIVCSVLLGKIGFLLCFRLPMPGGVAKSMVTQWGGTPRNTTRLGVFFFSFTL